MRKNRNPIVRRNPPVRECIALSLVPNLGAHRISRLLDKAEHPRDIFRMDSGEITSVYGIGPVTAGKIRSFNRWDEVDRILEESNRVDAEIITCFHEHYPRLLKEIYDPPVYFWLKGDPAVLDRDGISIVGTRRMTRYGEKMATRFARKLVENNLVVVSGLALGVDSVAHRTALEGNGRTVAVLGSGIDNVYPYGNRGLAREIIERDGAVLSEFPPGTKPDASNFPVRNRIVSGMTLGTLVIESGIDGGSMITAKSALDQNREVFVVPHSLENPNGEGCNRLIQSGMGKLVQDEQDLFEELPGTWSGVGAEPAQAVRPWKEADLGEREKRVCRLLEEEPLHIDRISEQLNLPVSVLLPVLLELEVKQCVRQQAGKVFALL